MKTRKLCFLALLAMVFCFTAWPGLAQKTKGDPEAKEAIAKNGEAFVEAFHKADAKALAAFFTAEGDFTDQTGRQIKGRAALEKSFKAMFSETKGLKLHIESESLRFVTPDVAIEDGMTEVIPADGNPPTQARYTIVHVKQDGKWLLSSVRNSPYIAPSNHEHLRGLEWLIGDWTGPNEKGEMERLSFNWAEHQNFITATFSTTARNVPLASAKLWIGWDPVDKRVRSWMFDAAGGFGEGSWVREEKKWVVKTTSVRRDGKKATATYVLAPGDADTMTLQARDRTENGNPLPDTKEMKLRKSERIGAPQ
jgi:uncharacterized protein (TIGR02246 family)